MSINRVFLTLLFAAAPLFPMAGSAQAQSSDVPVVEVPEPSDEAIDEAVEIAVETGEDDELPEPSLDPAARLSASVIEAWLDDPAALLASNPTGGAIMQRYVALLAGSDARAVSALVVLAGSPEASRFQIMTIARGLASVALGAEQTAPDYAAYILFEVAGSDNDFLIGDFNRALRGAGDIETAEIPGPAGPAAPGVGTLSGGGDPGPGGAAGTVSVFPTSPDIFGPFGTTSSVGGVTSISQDPSPVSIGG